MYLHIVANLVYLNILAVPIVSFLHRYVQVSKFTGYVIVCVLKDFNTLTDFNVTVETLSGTALGEETVNL